MIYIKTSADSKSVLIEHMASIIGITPATNLVNNWYEQYTEIVFDEINKGVVFFKKYSTGYWEANEDLLSKMKVKK